MLTPRRLSDPRVGREGRCTFQTAAGHVHAASEVSGGLAVMSRQFLLVFGTATLALHCTILRCKLHGEDSSVLRA